MIKYSKELTVEDFYHDIKFSASRADIIFISLGLNYSRKFFVEEEGTYNTIEYLVERCLDGIHDIRGEDKEYEVSTGGFNVRMFVDGDGFINVDIYFDITL